MRSWWDLLPYLGDLESITTTFRRLWGDLLLRWFTTAFRLSGGDLLTHSGDLERIYYNHIRAILRELLPHSWWFWGDLLPHSGDPVGIYYNHIRVILRQFNTTLGQFWGDSLPHSGDPEGIYYNRIRAILVEFSTTFGRFWGDQYSGSPNRIPTTVIQLCMVHWTVNINRNARNKPKINMSILLCEWCTVTGNLLIIVGLFRLFCVTQYSNKNDLLTVLLHLRSEVYCLGNVGCISPYNSQNKLDLFRISAQINKWELLCTFNSLMFSLNGNSLIEWQM